MRAPLAEMRCFNKDYASHLPRRAAAPTKSAPTPLAEGMGAFPFPRDTIKAWIQDKVFAATGQRIDPDKTYLHQFSSTHTVASGGTSTGWQHNGRPEKTMTLTDAVASDFFSAERYGAIGEAQAVTHFLSSNVSPFSIFHSESVSDFFSRLGRTIFDRTGPGYIYSKIHDDVPQLTESWRDLDAAYGLYLDGPEKGRYDADNELRLKPSELLNIVREGDLQKKVLAKLDAFWSGHMPQWRAMAKGQFVKEAKAALALHQANPAEGLSPQDYQRVMRAAAANVPLEGPATPAQCLALAAPDPDSKVLGFDINGYVASDILRFVSRDGSEVLYVPGATPALLKFNDRVALNRWVAEQGKDPAKAMALAQHFSLKDRQQGIFGALSVNGVDSALQKIGAGTMAANGNHINSRNYPIAEDVFSVMARQTRERIASDTDTEMKSNAEVYKDNALGMLQAGNALLSIPLALLGPIGLAIGGAALGAQVGMEVDKAVEGDTQAERQAGLQGAVMDVATLAFFHAAGKAGASLGAARAPAERTASAGVNSGGAKPFFNYRRVNGQVGVLMSPTRPHALALPEPELNPAWDPTMEVYLEPGRRRAASGPRVDEEQAGSGKRLKLHEPQAQSPASPDSPDSPDSVASDATSSADYRPYDDSDVIRENPFQANVQLPAGGYFNSRGMIERTDLPKVYRVEKAERVERRGDPEHYGFMNSNYFAGAEKMRDGNVLVTSRSMEGAMQFGDSEFGGNYNLYEIDSQGIPAVSLNENIDLNPQFYELREHMDPGEIAHARANGGLKGFSEGAFDFDEVHLDNDLVGSSRIRRIRQR